MLSARPSLPQWRLIPSAPEKVDVEIIRKAVMEVFDLRPAAIISLLHLRSPYFSETTAYGHFNGYKGTWENVDKTKELEKAVKKYAD